MMCNCFGKMNDQLERYNTRIRPRTVTNRKTWKSRGCLEVVSEKIDHKNKKAKAVVLCAYCPFCGEKEEA